MKKDLKYWVWLSSIPGLGAVRIKNLLEDFETPENIWKASVGELKSIGKLAPGIVRKLMDRTLRERTKIHLENIEESMTDVITLYDSSYPPYLKNIYDPPITLYKQGKLIKEEAYVAVVGARAATPYGMHMAEVISGELSRFGITIVSGMARGIDSSAHSGALDAGGRTVAVLGCGPDIVYPPENKNLKNKILSSGAVLSEFLPGMPPVPLNFPARNRIISGMSLGVVVIEAGEKSGSLITANFALEQGREVFAVPGNINSRNSSGTNRLIKEGAKMVTGLEDILEELKIFSQGIHLEGNQRRMEAKARFLGLEEEERRVAENLLKESLHVDALVQRTQMPVSMVNSVLVMLELKGIVEQLPGKIFGLKE